MGKSKPIQGEDLFQDTTMTFGEHLEELRKCLFKAVLGLAAGFLIGLALSGQVVKVIEGPLKEALTAFQKKKSEESVRAKVAELREAGYPLPEDFEKDPEKPEESIRAKLAELRAAGHEVPDGIEKNLPKAEQFIKGVAYEQLERFVESVADKKLEEVYVNPRELLKELKKRSPGQFQNVPLGVGNSKGKDNPSGLVPVFIWHSIEKDVHVKGLAVPEGFSTFIKAAFVVGLIVASPWIFYQIWSFVAAGLYPREKKYVHIFLPFSLGLFLAGAALAFFFVFEPVLKFLFYFNDKLEIVPDIRISEWLSFVLILPLGFGIAFQLPLVMLFLERIGIFDVKAYLSRIRFAILLIFVMAMFLTPADPYSMLLMAVPLTILYFGGILLCKYMPRKRSPYDELED